MMPITSKIMPNVKKTGNNKEHHLCIILPYDIAFKLFPIFEILVIISSSL